MVYISQRATLRKLSVGLYISESYNEVAVCSFIYLRELHLGSCLLVYISQRATLRKLSVGLYISESYTEEAVCWFIYLRELH